VTRFLLVPSPLLGPSTWRATAAWLEDAGHVASVVDARGVVSAPELVERVVGVAASAPEPVVLVPHSNAGLCAPLVSARVELAGVVFVDAALPLGAGDTGLAPPELLEHLERLADADGLLPPWTQWWDDLAGVFPDEATHAEVDAEQPRMPLSYFRGRVPVPEGWASSACAYLAFGDTYAEEIAFARSHGWPVRVLAGRHLHQLHDPAAVGAAVIGLTGAAPVGL
jgi:hypothetical protein